MTESLAISIRTTQNGYIVSLSADQPNVMGTEFVALKPEDLRATTSAEIEKRLDEMIGRLTAAKD
ncbi:hypothetical protein [Celeribacter sp.]|uniref:hypothetical protein n=1 Tax=Celeribacter sp. TaxID=1890673 RepID=UPI003A958419